MRKTLLVFAGVALAFVVAQAPTALAKKSKKQEREEARARIHRKYREKMGGQTFWDCKYWVDLKKLGDKRWSAPDKHASYKDTKKGIQLYATFNLDNSADGVSAITVMAQKWLQTDTRSKYSMPFDNIGESHMLAQVKKCHDAFHRDWLETATDVGWK